MDQVPNTASWQRRQPHLTEIAALCEKFFSWGSSGDIVSRFKNTLWPGIAIQHLLQVRNKSCYMVCGGWHYFNPASHCWWTFSTICQWRHNSWTWTAYHHTFPSNLSSTTWPRCTFNKSRCDRLHNPDLNPWRYPWYGPWVGFWFTVAHPGSGIWLSKNFFLDPWFCSQGYIAWACQAVHREKSHSAAWKLLPCTLLYMFLIHPINEAPTGSFPFAWTSSARRSIAIAPSITHWWSRLFPFQVSPPSHISIVDGRLTNISSGDSATNPITIDFEDQELNLAINRTQEFVQGSSTGLGPVYLGYINLCTPSPSP